MTVSKPAAVDAAKPSRAGRKEPAEGSVDDAALQLGELSELLGYSLKRAQLRVFEDFLRCVAPLVMPSCTRNSMIVVFKTGRSPSRVGPAGASDGPLAVK